MVREAWRAAVHGVAKSQTWLSDWTELSTKGFGIAKPYTVTIYIALYGYTIIIYVLCCSYSLVSSFGTSWTLTHQAPLSTVIHQAKILEWVTWPPQWIFPTQGLNPALLLWRQILYHLTHQKRPRLLEWVAYPFSRGTFQPRNWTRVSCIASTLFTSRATREALGKRKTK